MKYQGIAKWIGVVIVFCLVLLPRHTRGEDLGEEEDILVTSTFFEKDIRLVLREISIQTGVKIVADATVQGNVSLELKEVPLEEALRMILSAGSYTFRRMPEGYYLIGLCTPNSPSFNQLSVTEYYRPNYIKVKELESLTSDFYCPYLRINVELNTITIVASADIVKRIKEDLITLDQPPRQVMIEALVVELSKEGKKSLGVNWGSILEGGFSVYPPSDLNATQPAANGKNEQLSAALSYDLFTRINSLISENKANIKANLHLATLEGKEARINIGREEYHLVNAGPGAQSSYTLQTIATGVVLKITPYVDKNNQITVTIDPEVSEVVGKGQRNLPIVNKRAVATSLRVNDGQTIAIGGLVQEEPKKTEAENKEVIIFITPYILNAETGSIKGVSGDRVRKGGQNQKDYPASSQDSLKKYCLQINNIIDIHKEFPKLLQFSARGQTKEVVVEFTLFSNGIVDNVKVIKTSGLPFLDLLVSKLIEDLSPFPSFPEEIKQPSVTFVIPIRYEP